MVIEEGAKARRILSLFIFHQSGSFEEKERWRRRQSSAVGRRSRWSRVET